MKKNNFYIIAIAFTAAIGGFLFGFDGAVISGAVAFYKQVFGLQDGSFMQVFSVSFLIWGAIFSTLSAGPLCDKIGRKPSLLIAALLFAATSIIYAFATTIEVFIAGRIIGGLGVGIAILVAPIYIAEISPDKKRGCLNSFKYVEIAAFWRAYSCRLHNKD